ncbi:transcriptional regulator [Candidatus Puniceispirillum sp.]|nr:transcriptional regulator [Candidatus Puniceispirillum sp.]
MFTKIFIRTFPSTEECELFESILQTRWPDLIGKAEGVRFTAWRNPQTPHISTVIWEFPNESAQKTIEKLIEEHIAKFTKTLSPKTITFSGQQKIELAS